MYPERADAPVPRLNWYESRHWDFFPPDLDKFPLLRLAYEAQVAQNSATCTLNAADEVAVEAFLGGLIPFTAIAAVVADTLEKVPARTPRSVQDVLGIDRQSRDIARECVRMRATVRV
jgi:1-deoxy-D-xylulose-5-phosphate reductoisomerase